MKKLLILHTGGTVGMDLTGSLFREPDSFLELLKKNAPRLFELAEIHLEILFNKDSSNMHPRDWVAIAKRLNALMNEFDAFVITHGTDTMAFTASALSFMLKHPPKSIVLTGSQKPLSDVRSDAPRNLINAAEVALSGKVKEVSIFFDSTLIRGNRAKKLSIPSYAAFDCPNFSPLARVGVDIQFEDNLLLPEGTYAFDPRIETSVLSLSLFPGVNSEFLFALINKGIRGLILQAFGPGDIPLGGDSVVGLIRALTEKGIPTIVCSQAVYGTVDLNLYETGRAARDAGAISAFDMTWETCVVKTMILLGRGLSLEPFRQAFHTSLAGELDAIE